MTLVPWIVTLLLHGTPSYTRLMLHELAAGADRIVVGEIVGLDEATFDLAVEQTLTGSPAKRLRLRKFENWMCAGRWAPYRVGQRLLLFIRGDRAMGAGNEGEMPLVGAGALVPYSVRGSRCVARPVDGDELDASWVSLDDVATALASFRASFELETNRYGEVGVARARVDGAALAELEARSGFARQLLDDMRRCTCWASEDAEDAVPADVLSAARAALDDRTWVPDDGREVLSSFGRQLVLRGDASQPELLVGVEGAVLRLTLDADLGLLLREAFGPGRDGRALFDDGDSSTAIAPFADLDGDGRDELVVSCTRPYGHGGRPDDPHEAALLVHSWKPGDDARSLAELRQRREHAGLVDGCRFGRALCAVGDLDGDGLPELAIARSPDVRWTHGVSSRSPGSLALLFLDREGAVRRWTAIEPAAVGHDSPAEFASVLAGPGDVDGDGVPDLVLGEPLDCAEGPYRGGLRVLFLTSAGEVRGWTRVASGAFGLGDGDELGVVLAPTGDLDGDGVPDLVAGGVDALWSVRLAPDGSARAVRRFELGALQPGAVEIVALAAGAPERGGVPLVMSARRGSAMPLDVGLDRLSVSSDGEIRQD